MSISDEKKYWKSPQDIEVLSDQPDPEFESSPLREGERDGSEPDDENRRTFLKLMGASFALMGASACTRRPVEKIVPYLKQPEEVTPGIANWYASTCGECASACGVLVKTREGRPVKFEGNPSHPISKGGLCASGQASVLNVYDADRLQSSMQVDRKGTGQSVAWDQVDNALVSKLRAAKGGGVVRLLTGELTSPSTAKLAHEFIRSFSNGEHIVYEPLAEEETVLSREVSFGARVFPFYRFDKAEMVVSFGADFLGTWGDNVAHNRGFAVKRKPSSDMSKFVAFESIMTLTGSNADERYTLKAGDELRAALALAHELIVSQAHSHFARDAEVTNFLRAFPVTSLASQLGVSPEVFRKTAADLWENKGKSIVLGGGHTAKGDAGVALDIVVNLLNSALENEGSTIDSAGKASKIRSSFQSLLKLVSEMKSGKVDVLIISGTNPVYSLPASLGFEDALSKVKTVVYHSMHLDETARKSDVVLAGSHHTEAWGDASPHEGIYSIIQPTISPLYSTRSFSEVIFAWSKALGVGGGVSAAASFHDYLKNNWKDSVYREYKVSAPFALFWESLLRDGVFDGHAARGMRSSDKTPAKGFSTKALKLVAVPASSKGGWSLVLYPKISIFDGRNANNAWLQELPDPVTKVTWDNYASISVAKAKAMGVQDGDVLKIQAGHTLIEVPAHVQPGMHDETIAVSVGYGRKGVGRVGSDVGVNVFPMAMPGNQALQLSGLSVQVEKTGKVVKLAATQKHHSLEGRPAVHESTLNEYLRNPHAGNEEHEEKITLWPKHETPMYRWGMTIDMNACTGCSSCVVACQAENNIPVVGKQFVLSSREMHWLRIDRYYSGKAENPEVVHQAMLCQHCENAPCETVCPVLATLHNDEGINQQVYNRCVGTRYCANNCPYKVRRFNWFTFSDVAKPMNLQYNPDVTVRTRGVMEKCTFCIQRIREAKDKAKDFGALVQDGDVKTACQQSCPTQAIGFGNLLDKESRVSKLSEDPRGYHVLSELNVKPSITYLTKIRNKKA